MIRDILAVSSIYEIFTLLIGGPKSRRILIDQYIRPVKGDRLLDLGCGPASMLDFLPGVEYHGCDISKEYIHFAQHKYGMRGEFLCEGINRGLMGHYKDFDLVIAIGLIHHLNDNVAGELFELSKSALKPGGRLLTIDPCFHKDCSAFVKFMLSRDRGEYVRTQEQYLALAKQQFDHVRVHARGDLLNVPYSHLIMECSA